MRIGVASVQQESNTFSSLLCEIEDFVAHGLYIGDELREHLSGTNTEVAGALQLIDANGETAVPVFRAWAQSSGRVSDEAFDALRQGLTTALRDALPLDGLILALHGAMVTESIDSADAELVSIARSVVGESVPIAVTLDLHSNVTGSLAASSDILIGYKTHPHVDMFETGERAARLLLSSLNGEIDPVHCLAKRPMLVPAEAMLTTAPPMRILREEAARAESSSVLDISLFPVQPWLDVPELGFGVVVTTNGDRDGAERLAERLVQRAWELRRDFQVPLLTPEQAVEAARASAVRPFLISESADSPSAGAAADSPVMIDALLRYGTGLSSIVTIVDEPAVGASFAAGVGGSLTLDVGCTIDSRFHEPVRITGVIDSLGKDPVVLTGPSFTGMKMSMGRFAVLRSGDLSVLLTERPAYTADPQTFRHAGLNPDESDVIVVRSATQFRAGYPHPSGEASVILDVAGASTPSFERLRFTRLSEVPYPLEELAESVSPDALIGGMK